MLDLTEDAAYQLGIFDLLSSADHEWCQWFAHLLQRQGFFKGRGAFDGMLYPSRKNRGVLAIALASSAVDGMRAQTAVQSRRFRASPPYKSLLGSGYRTESP